MNKKNRILVICVLFLMMLSQVSYAEQNKSIIFHNIPWYSDESTTMTMLSDILRPGFDYPHYSYESGIIIQKDEMLNGKPISTKEYSDVILTMSLSSEIQGKIAGYRIKKMVFTYAYDGISAKLICVNIELYGSSFDDLASKLCCVYGKGIKGFDDSGLLTMMWTGSEDSCVLLYSVDNGDTADIIYGCLNAEQMIQDIDNITTDEIDVNDISGL